MCWLTFRALAVRQSRASSFLTHSLQRAAYPHQPYVDTLYVLPPRRRRPKRLVFYCAYIVVWFVVVVVVAVLSNLNVIYLMVTVETCYNDNVDYCNDRLQSFTWRSWVQIPLKNRYFFLGFLCNCFSCFTTAKITFTSILICFVCASSQSLTVTLSKKTFSPLITQFVFRCFVWFCCCCCCCCCCWVTT